MAITDTPQTQTDATAASALNPTGSAVAAPRGIAGVLGTGDHTTLGRLYVGSSLVLGVVSFVLFGLFALDGLRDVNLLGANAFRAFTLGQLGIVFLFLVPLFIGLATAVVPLQVGASTIAFPRAAAAAFWTWLLSSLLLLISYIPAVGGGIGIDPQAGKLDGQLLSLLALGGVVVALLLASVCIATTVITLRAPGMALDRVPMFSWSMVVAAGIWILTLSVFLANLALVFVDAKYGRPSLFGVSFNQWHQLSWVLTPPQVFAFAIPALGIVADVVGTFARVRQPQRAVLLVAIGAFGAFGFGAYAQPAFNPGVNHQWLTVLQGFLVILPVLAVLGGCATAMRKGKPALRSPALLGLVSLLLLLLASVLGALFGIGRLGFLSTAKSLADADPVIRTASSGSPIYTWGVLGLVVVAAAAAGIAGIFYWAPKLTGRLLPDGLGKLLALVVLGGAVLFGAPLLVLGMANKLATGVADGADALFGATVAGAGLAVLALVIVLVLFASSRGSVLAGGATADPDAWGFGQTLEWACASPPAPGNFGELADVTSAQPLLDRADNDNDNADNGGQA